MRMFAVDEQIKRDFLGATAKINHAVYHCAEYLAVPRKRENTFFFITNALYMYIRYTAYLV
jgi:hypothetical protein